MADALKNSNPFVENNSKHIRLNFKNLHENESREDTDGIVGVNGNCEIKKDNFSSNEIGVVKSGFQNTLPGENQPKNSYSGISGDSRIPVGDSSDSGHDSHGLDDDDDDGDGSNGGDDDGDDGSPKTDNGDLKVKKFGDGAIKSEKNENFSPASDIEMIKEAMKNVKLTSKTGTQKNVETTNRNTGINRRTASVEKSNRGSNRTVDTNSSNDSKNCNNDNINNSSNSIINSSNDNSRNRNNSYNSNSTNASRNVICNTTDDVNATGARMLNSTNSCTDSTNRHNDNSTKRHDDNITKRHDDNSTQRHNDNSTNKHDDNSTNRHDNSTQRHDDNSTNKHDDNSTQRHDDNSTNRHDDNSRYFTIIQDSSKDSSCKRCPQLNASCKQWSKLLENLFPRARYTGRIAAVIAVSILLLLTVFLLARIPSSGNDVAQPAMYDLPDDDAFRPPGQALLQLHRHDHLLPPPGSKAHLRELARRHGVALHPELGVPVDEEYIKLEKDRKFKLAQMRAAARKKDMKEVLAMVKDTIEDERSQMKDKEKLWSKDVTPLRILLVSTWRSGSTFLGQAILQHPGVFEHYEPFSYAGIRQIRSGTEAFQSQQFLHRLLECRFSGQDMYLNYTRQYPQDMIGHNKRIWGPCSKTHRVDLCSNATFLTEACNMFPIQLVKSVRLRLNLTQLFLGETRLNAKVIFLIRDPRATMNSRRSSVAWCEDSPDCSSPEILCSDLREDLKVAAALERLYPNSFTMLRYEDLANDPQNVLKKLFDFLGMYYSKEMADFVSKHTESEVEKPWSIARKSAARVSRWKEKMKPQDIQEIENVCRPVIEKLNYELVDQK